VVCSTKQRMGAFGKVLDCYTCHKAATSQRVVQDSFETSCSQAFRSLLRNGTFVHVTSAQSGACMSPSGIECLWPWADAERSSRAKWQKQTVSEGQPHFKARRASRVKWGHIGGSSVVAQNLASARPRSKYDLCTCPIPECIRASLSDIHPSESSLSLRSFSLTFSLSERNTRRAG